MTGRREDCKIYFRVVKTIFYELELLIEVKNKYNGILDLTGLISFNRIRIELSRLDLEVRKTLKQLNSLSQYFS